MERRDSCLRLTDIVLAGSGSIFQASRYARERGASYATVAGASFARRISTSYRTATGSTKLHGRLWTRRIHHWRDKRGHEVDFVLALSGRPPMAIERKWRPSDVNPPGESGRARW
ncbi:MAG: hypothetical protein C4306_07720 [Thermoleophilia bacterium]